MNTNRRLVKAVERAIQHSGSLLDLLEIAMTIDPQIEWVIELLNENESSLSMTDRNENFVSVLFFRGCAEKILTNKNLHLSI